MSLSNPRKRSFAARNDVRAAAAPEDAPRLCARVGARTTSGPLDGAATPGMCA